MKSSNAVSKKVFGGLFAALLGLLSISATHAQINTLASFYNSNGLYPEGGLTVSGSTLYGTTATGGANGGGTVFAYDLQSAPEPSTWALCLGGLGLLAFWRLRTRRA